MQANRDDAQTLRIWDEPPVAAGGDHHEGIDRREKLSKKEFLHEYVLKRRNVILTDAVANWNARTKWTTDFFKERFGSWEVPVYERKRAVTVREVVRLEDYLEEIVGPSPSGVARYLFGLRIARDFPELLSDMEPRPIYWDPNWLESRYLLPGVPNFKLRNITGLEMNISGCGSSFPFLHYDDLLTQTFITQLLGRKAWVMYKPDHGPYMYPSEQETNISSIPTDRNVDLHKFPLFRRAKPLRFVLEEGEMLYGAPGWWHTTRSLSPSIAVIYSTANGPIWWGVTKSSFVRAWTHPRWYLRPAAVPIGAYMTAFGVVKSITDPY